MSIIEQIKAEIERRMRELDEQIVDIQDSKAVLRKDELQKLLSFLSTLESKYPIPNDAEEAAKEYARYHYADTFSQELAENDFLAGSAWKEMRMMKDALHGWLDEDNEPPYDLNVLCEEKIPFGKFKHGDKVKIIIIKDSEK